MHPEEPPTCITTMSPHIVWMYACRYLERAERHSPCRLKLVEAV
jgi:hypothetical protein